jgi:hypothetical protein
MVLLGDVWRLFKWILMLKWKHVSVCLEIVLILTQDRPRFVPNVPLPQKTFWTHPMELLGDVGRLEPHFSLFRDGVSVSAR